MTDDRANTPICPWCGEGLEMLVFALDNYGLSMSMPISLDCSSEACEYGISLAPQPTAGTTVASGSVGRA